jgi:hypothetical protein
MPPRFRFPFKRIYVLLPRAQIARTHLNKQVTKNNILTKKNNGFVEFKPVSFIYFSIGSFPEIPSPSKKQTI